MRQLQPFRTPAPMLALVVGALWLSGPPPAAAAEDEPALAMEGRSHYRLYCTGCHGWAGRGDGPMARSLELELVDFRSPAFRWDTDGDGRAGQDSDLRNVIHDGVAAYLPECAAAEADESAVLPSACMMPAFAEVLDEAAIRAVIAYLRSLEGTGRRARPTPAGEAP